MRLYRRMIETPSTPVDDHKNPRLLWPSHTDNLAATGSHKQPSGRSHLRTLRSSCANIKSTWCVSAKAWLWEGISAERLKVASLTIEPQLGSGFPSRSVCLRSCWSGFQEQDWTFLGRQGSADDSINRHIGIWNKKAAKSLSRGW